MNRLELIKKIVQLSVEFKRAEGVQFIMCLQDMENAVIEYENHYLNRSCSCVNDVGTFKGEDDKDYCCACEKVVM